MHLHEFLAQMHQVIKPDIYLEVGVQHGTSLKLATTASRAVGIDPEPLHVARNNQVIYKMTSDDYFDHASDAGGHAKIDFGFIDGLHHFEQALRDFLNIERYAHEKTIVVFDDVLPRNQEEAQRVQCPGDWTGDVWKVTHMLLKFRPELRIREVNTSPTGTLVVWGFPVGKPSYVPRNMDRYVKDYMHLTEVPQGTIDRDYAVDPEAVLADIEEFLA
jgi:hypothetical protein